MRALVFFSLFVSLPALSQTTPDFISAKALGGDTTVYFKGQSLQSFNQPAANLTADEVAFHTDGDAQFERNFSDELHNFNYGLGPVFNNTSCASCHAKDGRGALPVVPGGNTWVQLMQNESVFLRISIEDGTEENQVKSIVNNWGAPKAVPGFSTQLFHLGSYGLREDQPSVGQAQVFMNYEKFTFTYPDGRAVEIRRPIFRIENPYDLVIDPKTGAKSSRLFQPDVRIGARIGTPMIGLGLLEAIKESDIIALAARDLSKEGVHGKANYVFDIEKQMAGNPYPVSIGRFGLKNNTPSVFHQSMGALQGDIGVTNYAFPLESIFNTPLFDAFKHKLGDIKVEATKEVADALVFYSTTLAVPGRRDTESEIVQRGGQLFASVSCTSCHQPSFTTGPHKIAALANQKIYPFTDMLLHDMGEGLADGRRDFDANGRQWKTRPLWGIGQTQTINPRAGFLHDGRARTLEEAILWHGGEGEYSKNKFVNLPQADRDALVAFLKSL
ncbi:di-heme oxidoredictase family protein [Bdellovibrio sp. HCB337]|uniref:di-heme oxidoredictase family protein n=1 Tax=Bdellovibrio sp. HCB337 TaxID=3394358 RepID=UPI0039A4AB8B